MICFKEQLPPQITEYEEREIVSHWNDENKERLIEGNMRLALFIAKRFAGKMDDDDLVGVSMFGLVKAARAFDPNKGVKFNTFASHVIQNEILHALRRQKKTYQDISMQSPVTMKEDQECELGDMIPDKKAERSMENVENAYFIENMSKCLTDRERQAVNAWINGMKQIQISHDMGISQAMVSRIQNKAFRKMKERSKLDGY